MLHRQIERIRSYTQANNDLLRAHHFLYDLPLDRSSQTFEFLVMGINPGEQKGDWEAWPKPTEETSLFDFRERLGRRPPASERWRSLVEYFCGTTNVVMSEFFLWSSVNSDAAFTEKFTVPIQRSPHLPFCAEVNLELVRHYAVRAVVAPGLKSIRLFAEPYGLRHVRTIPAGNGHTLVEHFDREGTPWLFTKHWSAAFGFSTDQRERIRDYIAEVSPPHEASPAKLGRKPSFAWRQFVAFREALAFGFGRGRR
ncbi:hypothetical protein PRN20_16715 [Devosia sp. ZB163]|uniref:hypothetical protein n=1 Tax=Devosia sp. ZB163 TaxID=3025938 RepID=UPI002362C3B6|nr:hypothetical protein [Devosia sp. ZB163]MDC9825375.1 hypothetical protein [Devosia sp. ZB163]